jgi:hypothetical protein
MARQYGREYPERPLMSVISDLLGIDHFTTSRGSTVRRDFLDAVAYRLGVAPDRIRSTNKDGVLQLAVEAATRAPMDPGLLSEGETVTNEALRAILDGLLLNGVPGRVAPREPVEQEAEPGDDEFDPSGLEDARDRRLVEVAAREGQDRFREQVMDAYEGKCAITRFDAVQALEAAHIYPYRGPGTNKVSNGLLLRADLHRLFDRGALAIDEGTFRVLLRPHLLPTKYGSLVSDQVTLWRPKPLRLRPSTAALRSHREWAGL